MRVCNVSTCPNLTDRGKCKQHRSEARKKSDAKRPSARARGYDAKWERTSKAYLAIFTTCEEPGCAEPSIEVHHLDGQGPLGPRGHDYTNLEALCKAHHSRRTAKEQPGGFNA